MKCVSTAVTGGETPSSPVAGMPISSATCCRPPGTVDYRSEWDLDENAFYKLFTSSKYTTGSDDVLQAYEASVRT